MQEKGWAKMNSFKVIEYEKVRGDATREYIIKVSSTAIVRDVIADILKKNEWGYIGIKDDEEPFFGAHRLEYTHDKLKIISEEEKRFWDNIMNQKVIALKGSGGWSRSDYQIVL